MLKWQIGDTKITQLLEISDGSGALDIIPAAKPDSLGTIPWLKPHFVSPEGNLILNIQMLIIETPS